MLKEVLVKKKSYLFKKEVVYADEPITDKSAIKKEQIIGMVSEADQLNLLATIVEQIGDKIGLDTPEYTNAKEVLANIRAVLGE